MGTLTVTSKNHEEWLKSREGGIGSSEVATVLGVNPYDTPYKLWLRKTGQVQTEERENFLMKAGHYLEDAISHFCADEAGLDIVKSSASEFVVIDKEKPFLRVSPDRYAYPKGAKHTNDNKIVIECKSTQRPVDPENLSRYWFCQVSYQLHVTRIPVAYIAWLTQGRDFGCKPICYDPDFARFIAEEVERFWVDCVLGGREPALSDIGDVLIKYPRHEEGKKAYATDDLVSLWGDLKDTNAEIKRLQSHKEEIESAMKASMLDAERLVIAADNDNPERTIATWKASKDSSKFDVDSFKADNPGLYESYLRPVAGSRRFSLK